MEQCVGGNQGCREGGPVSVLLPPGYPELLGTLAASLDEALGELLPDMPAQERGDFALQLAEACRATIGGARVPAVPRVATMDLRTADRTYQLMAAAWGDRLATTCPTMPEGWRTVAVAQLLHCLRQVLGGFTVPVGRSLLQHRNERMYRAFKGDFQEVGLDFGVCAERARQIITAKLKADREARQKGLFDGSDS